MGHVPLQFLLRIHIFQPLHQEDQVGALDQCLGGLFFFEPMRWKEPYFSNHLFLAETYGLWTVMTYIIRRFFWSTSKDFLKRNGRVWWPTLAHLGGGSFMLVPNLSMPLSSTSMLFFDAKMCFSCSFFFCSLLLHLTLVLGSRLVTPCYSWKRGRLPTHSFFRGKSCGSPIPLATSQSGKRFFMDDQEIWTHFHDNDSGLTSRLFAVWLDRWQSCWDTCVGQRNAPSSPSFFSLRHAYEESFRGGGTAPLLVVDSCLGISYHSLYVHLLYITHWVIHGKLENHPIRLMCVFLIRIGDFPGLHVCPNSVLKVP